MKHLLIVFIAFLLAILITLLILPAWIIYSWKGKWEWQDIKHLYKFWWKS